MAVNAITTTMAAGVVYTYTTDSNIDWSGVTNDTYFYDLTDKLVYYKDSTGTILSLYSSSSGGTGTDYYVTGGTYNPTTDVITLTRNDAVTIDITGVTDNFVVAGSYNDSTDTISLLRQDGSFVNITGVTDTFTTGGTYDNGTSIITLTRNDSTTYGVDLTSLPSTDEVTIEINSLNEITLKEVVGAPSGGTRTFDSFITITSGLTLNNLGTGTSVNNLGIDSNGNIVIGTSGGTGTDYYVTGGTYNSGSLTLDRNDGNSVVVTGFLTGNTLQEVLVNGNTSGGNDIIMTEGDDVVFNYSTFANYINTQPLTANRNILFQDKSGTVALLSDTTGHTENYYVTGFTYNDANTFTISQNGGLGDLTSTINNVTGLTVNGNLDIIGDINVTGTTYYTNITGTSIGVDYIDFNNALTPLPADQEGRIYWDEDNGTLSLGMHGGQVVQQIGLENYYYVKNQSGATIENGRVVRAAGTLGSSGRILGEYMIADGTIPAKFTLGIATEDIIDGDDGYVTEFGLVRGIDASGTLYGESWSGGTILYVSPTTPGGLTSVEPQAPDLKIEMAIVIDADANGSIFVRPTIYPHIYDLQEVNYTGGSENNLDILQWNSSNSTWDKTNTPSFSGLTMYGDITMDESALRYIKSSGPSETSRIKFGSSGSSVNMEWIGGGNNTIIDVNGTSFISVSSSKPSFGGIVYGADYSLNYDDRSLIDLGYFNSNDRYVTGFTYNDANTLTLSRSAGLSDLTTSINTLTGLTINGNLDVSGTLNIGTIGTGTSVNNIGIDSSGNIVTGNTGSGIYGGDGVVPLDTTVSVNGNLTFQGLDEDTRLIVKDGNNGGEVHLFSDGSAGQSALEFYNPGGVTLTSKIQNAGGDTRFISNNRDLLFTTNTGVTTEGIFIQAGTGNMGIGTITPTNILEVVQNTEKFKLDLDDTNGPKVVLSTPQTDKYSEFIISDGVSILTMGTLGFGWTGSTVYGNPGDSSIYSNTSANGVNIISAPGTGTEDYIRLYAGGNPQTSTASIHIQGSGSTKGYVGIGTETPSESLDVVGNTTISGTLNIGTIGGGTPVGNLGFDSNGQVVTGTTASGVSDANKVFSWFMNVT